MLLSEKIVCLLSIPKTLFFNLRYFEFKQAIKLPVMVSYKTYLKKTKGKIHLENPSTFIIKIGFGDIGIFDKHQSRSIWSVEGEVFFKGAANIGHGSKFSVNKNGRLTIGDKFSISAESSIVCSEEIIIGEGVLLSWDILVMDTDLHAIFDENGELLNCNEKITIADHVWIGCRSTILKGTNIPCGSVIAANTIVASEFNQSNTIIGGNPGRVLKENINWNY